ncbi:hypothetical protein [Candidatus Thiosymbion oneisti]|uniref:hypothetical protein n=1 Tax=Candidatus Thiosymbion oneisti TaxID=589554 RepID=UPI00114D0C79|nr:hypothetical protein [Candidatus Thiosymbion oneisti]
MISSISKLLIVISAAAISGLGCAATHSSEAADCVENILNVDIVRIDETNHRFFIVGNMIKALDIKNNLVQINRCFVGTPWKDDWALSVFTEAKFAGYKDEEHIIPYHSDNSWAKAYTMEYDRFTKTLTINPATDSTQLMP